MAMRIVKINLSKSEFWIASILMLWNFFSKLPYITTRDLSWDEPFSAFYSQFSIPQIVTEMFKGNNPPFYEIFLHLYTALFGLSETALRMPSLLFSCATVGLLFYTGSRIKGKWVGIFVSFLFIYNNLQFFYSLAARMYALFSMLVAACIYLSVLCYQQPDRRKNFYALLIVNVVLCYTHYFSGIVILAQVVAWLFAFKNKIFFKSIFLVLVANMLLVLPLLFVFYNRAQSYTSTYNFIPPTPEIWKNVIMNLINGMDVYELGYSFLSLGFIVFVLMSAYRRKLEFKNIYYYVLLFLLFAMPLSLTWYFGNTFPLFIDRYYLYATVPMFLFFAMAVSTFFRPVGALLVPIFFLYILNTYYKSFNRLDNNYLLREWQGAALSAKEQQQAHANSIILLSPLWADLGFSYYYDRILFYSPETYNIALESRKVYRIWSSDSLIKILKHHAPLPIIYYADETAAIDSTHDGNFRLLQRVGYVKDETLFFPACTNVISLHYKDTSSAK